MTGFQKFCCFLAIIGGFALGVFYGILQDERSVSNALTSLQNSAINLVTSKAEQEAEQHVPGLQDSYAHIQINQLAATPPLVGPFDNLKDRLDWQGHFVGYMAVLNAKRLAKAKDKLVYKIDFVKPKASSPKTSSAKDWTAGQTVDWIKDHS